MPPRLRQQSEGLAHGQRLGESRMRKKYKAEVVTAVKPIVPIKCEECKKRFPKKYPEQRYCSRPCYTAYLKAHAPGHRLEKLFKPRNVKQHLSDPLEEIDDELWAER